MIHACLTVALESAVSIRKHQRLVSSFFFSFRCKLFSTLRWSNTLIASTDSVQILKNKFFSRSLHRQTLSRLEWLNEWTFVTLATFILTRKIDNSSPVLFLRTFATGKLSNSQVPMLANRKPDQSKQSKVTGNAQILKGSELSFFFFRISNHLNRALFDVLELNSSCELFSRWDHHHRLNKHPPKLSLKRA